MLVKGANAAATLQVNYDIMSRVFAVYTFYGAVKRDYRIQRNKTHVQAVCTTMWPQRSYFTFLNVFPYSREHLLYTVNMNKSDMLHRNSIKNWKTQSLLWRTSRITSG